MPTAVRGDAESLTGCHRMGDGPIFLKTFSPLSLVTTSLGDSPFKDLLPLKTDVNVGTYRKY
jgi:hypothetical protein